MRLRRLLLRAGAAAREGTADDGAAARPAVAID
jgi:hypothetical protein